jgi:hypothetical protein
MESIKIHVEGVSSSQEWTADPEMVEVTVPASFIPYAEACRDFMQQVQNADEIRTWNGFDYALFFGGDLDHGEATEGLVAVNGAEYAPFEPEYTLVSSDVLVDRYGDIKVEIPFKHSSDKLWFSIGSLDDLKAKFEAAQQEEQNAKPKMGM